MGNYVFRNDISKPVREYDLLGICWRRVGNLVLIGEGVVEVGQRCG